MTEKVALTLRTNLSTKECELFWRLDSLRDNTHMQALTHTDDGADNAGIVCIRCEIANKRLVNLQAVDWKAFEKAQARITGPKIVKREADAHSFDVMKHNRSGLRIL
jgi:hypothetical protein